MYRMQDEGEEQAEDQILLVKRINITFDNQECQMLNFTNITNFHKLKKEEETTKLLKALNTSVHHEMLTPLSTNVMIADRLKNSAESEQQKKMIMLIQTCSNLALFHANDLLDYRIIQNGSFSSTLTSESIAETIQQTIQLIQYTLQHGNLKVEQQNSNQVVSDYKFFMDKRRIQQVLLNLLSNACKFQKKGKVLVSYSLTKLEGQENDYALEVKVADNGIGIDQSDIECLFRPFWMSEKNRSNQYNARGNGLGLSICKQICQVLGGDIWLDSTSEQGSVFIF